MIRTGAPSDAVELIVVDSDNKTSDARICNKPGMTRSKELRRIEAATEHRNKPELEWALRQCEIRKKYMKGHSSYWYRIETRIRAALDEIQGKSE